MNPVRFGTPAPTLVDDRRLGLVAPGGFAAVGQVRRSASAGLRHWAEPVFALGNVFSNNYERHHTAAATAAGAAHRSGPKGRKAQVTVMLPIDGAEPEPSNTSPTSSGQDEATRDQAQPSSQKHRHPAHPLIYRQP